MVPPWSPAGAGLLGELSPVINATQCALTIQAIMATRSEPVPGSRRMRVRHGINLVDVVPDESRIYVAASMSRRGFDQVSVAQGRVPGHQSTFESIAPPGAVFAVTALGRYRPSGGPRAGLVNALGATRAFDFPRYLVRRARRC
jgi:hypothetical protein